MKTRSVVEEIIDKTFPWRDFDGSVAGEPKVYGVGDMLYIVDDHFLLLKLVWVLVLTTMLSFLV